MSRLLRVLIVPAIAAVVFACASPNVARWTAPPSAPASDGSTASASQAPPSVATATATASQAPASEAPADPAGSDSVLPSLVPKADLPPVPGGEVNVAYAPNVPPAATRTTPALVEVHFDVVEGVKAIDPNGTQYLTWGYRLHGDDTVTTGTPGPIIRARVGDVLRFSLTNNGSMPHNVDMHAVTGQGGGAKDLTVAPGETATIEARLLYPGMFMYHCAAGDVPAHVVEGMYGGILVDPQTPLPAVEHELYMVQSEYYTTGDKGGTVTTDRSAVTLEHPEFVVFNGAVGSLTGDNAPRIQVGETIRIYFVNAGLNLDSNFHPIGSHWDRVWEDAATLNAPLRGVQTTLVPAGGGVVVDLIGQVPQTVILVDHALARAFDQGAIGQIVITGDANPEIFEATGVTGTPAPASPVASSSPSESPASPAASTPVASGDQQIDILPGAGTFQADNAPDEFAAQESPADYSVNDLTVSVGTKVTWTNTDPDMSHTVTAVDGSFDSGLLATGDSFSYTFESPGEFEYFCTPHPWMRARVSVMAP